MTRKRIAAGVFAAVLILLAVAVSQRAFEDAAPASAGSPSVASFNSTEAHPGAETYRGFLYGRITTFGELTYEGRLRFGGDEEAFWGDYFNGFKPANPWIAHVPQERQPRERRSIKIFGVEIARPESEIEYGRPFMARFGDIARIEASGLFALHATLKSGTVVGLDRFAASDFDDGVRVWDGRRGVVDLDSLWIRTIEFLPVPPLGAAPYRLHGTVHTPQGDFTGFIQWDREENVGSDELDGRTADGKLSLRFDTIRSIERSSRDSSLVTLLDGREIALSGTREVGHGNRGIYVDEPRYGRVLVSWNAFESAEFNPGGSGPGYEDFPPGQPLRGSVTTRDGLRLEGRLVFDLDESETSETLDAPIQGVDYTIPFGLIASITLPGREEQGARRARVSLQSGEELPLELTGDLGEGNAGILIFVGGRQVPEYVPWSDVAQVEFDRPEAMYPPIGHR